MFMIYDGCLHIFHCQLQPVVVLPSQVLPLPAIGKLRPWLKSQLVKPINTTTIATGLTELLTDT